MYEGCMRNSSIGRLKNAKDVKIIDCFYATEGQGRRRPHIVKLKLLMCGVEVVQTVQWILTKEKDI